MSGASPKTITGYWFASSDELPHGDGRKVIIGETLSIEGPIKLCYNGLHASREAFDALQHASTNCILIYKVESSGEMAEDRDKYCSRYRKTIAVIDATSLLRQFAREQALSVKHLWDMPRIVEEYLKTGAEDIRGAAAHTARAARTAAYAAHVAADAAARGASTAAYAARAAAYAADACAADAYACAADADACAAAAYAADATAHAAAYAAARAAARKRFNEMVDEAFKGSLT